MKATITLFAARLAEHAAAAAGLAETLPTADAPEAAIAAVMLRRAAALAGRACGQLRQLAARPDQSQPFSE
jgi:hypothetical protein